MFISRIPVVIVFVILALVDSAFTNTLVQKDDLSEGTELLFTLTLQRHGDRTPERISQEKLSHYGDINVIDALIAPYGEGQLTNKGIRTAYKTGEFIRRRYKDFLPLKYNDSEVYIRSTDVTRTKMSILSAMAATFPPVGDTWSKDIHWVPVPYTTQEENDFMYAFDICPDWTILDWDGPADLTPYNGTIKAASVILKDRNLTSTPLQIFSVNDVYNSLISLGYNVGSQVRALKPDIAAAAAKAWDVVLADDNRVQLLSGVLLNEFFTYGKMIISGQATPKARIYSAHDMNVYSLEVATQVTERQGIPKYGSLYALELRKVLETGQYVVLPVYLADPNTGVEKYLRFQGCDVLCDFNDFYNLTKKYLIGENEWKRRCVTDDI